MNLVSDLQKMTDTGTTTPFVSDPRGGFMSADEHDFRVRHGGMSRPDWAAFIKQRDAQERADAAEAAAMAPYREGSPPKGSGLNGWKLWCGSLRDEIDALESAAARLQKHLAAPTTTEESLRDAIARGARRMLASVGIGSSDAESEESHLDAEQLAKRLEAERRASAEAQAALEIVNSKIATARKNLAAVETREFEFLYPELQDIASRLSQSYVRKIAELSEISSYLFALGKMVGATGDFGNGWRNFDRVTLPKPPLPNCKSVPDNRFDLKVDDAHVTWWLDVKCRLLADPQAKISIPLKH
jgi:hypothetical protein